MDFIKLHQISRGVTKPTWINKKKIIYIQPYEGVLASDQAATVMLVEEVEAPLFVSESCDEIFREIEKES